MPIGSECVRPPEVSVTFKVGTIFGTASSDADLDDDSGDPFADPDGSAFLAARYRAWFFGPFRVTVRGDQGGELECRRTAVKKLLKWFLLHPLETMSGDQLIELLWPERRPLSAVDSLNVTLHYLRRWLEPELLRGQSSRFVRTDGRRNYWFDPAAGWWNDVQGARELEQAARRAERRQDAPAAMSLYRRLVGYYRLPFLPEDVYDDAFSDHRHEFEIARSRALERFMWLCLETGQLAGALSSALQVLAFDPYNRAAVRAIVDVYLRQGNLTAAVCQLDEFMLALDRELGIPGDRELLNLRGKVIESLRAPHAEPG